MPGFVAAFLVGARASNKYTTGSRTGALWTSVDLFHPWSRQRVVLLILVSSQLCKTEDPSVAVALLGGIRLSASSSKIRRAVPRPTSCLFLLTTSTASSRTRGKTPRWKKHMALSLQCNFVGAYALAFLVGVLVVGARRPAASASGREQWLPIGSRNLVRRVACSPCLWCFTLR